ncbi:MAG: hypothetical protein OHK0022_20120 [Roseiflexaceae bacterium]
MVDPAVDLDLTLRPTDGACARVELRISTPLSAAPIMLPEPVRTAPFDRTRLNALALDPDAYGRTLTAMLFNDALLRRGFAQARAVAQQARAPLRVRLSVAPGAPDLEALRWETMRDPDEPSLPLASGQVLFSRFLGSADWQPVRRRQPGPLHALIVVAAPTDLVDYGLSRIDAAQEIALAQAALAGAAPPTILGGSTRATLDALTRALYTDYDLVYLLAHGRQDEAGATWLYLEDAQGETAPLPGAKLVTRVAGLDIRPRLVILAACHSAGDGTGPALASLGPQLIGAGVPAVLAMQGAFTQETARRFLPALLTALQTDGRIDRAVAVARDLVRDRPDAWAPALFLRLTDGRLWEPPAPEPAAVARTPAALHQLRPALPDFVGRTDEISRLLLALRRGAQQGACAAITGVRGMGGLGKTTLAELVAHRLLDDFPDAQLVIDLRGATRNPLPPALALQQLIRAFVPDERLPDDLPALQARYRSLLHGKRALILADDACDAAQVRPLLPPAGCALLITSRQRFALDGMTALDLSRLAEHEAVLLLRSICPRLSEPQAKRLAGLCSGLPLALRISAGILANDDALPIDTYLTQLADERRRLVLLRDPDDPERDVEASLQLSYAALDEATQRLFRRLGVLATEADLALIAAVLDLPEAQADIMLRQLLRRNLIEYDTARARWNLHDLVRVFALEELERQGEEREVRLRYARRVIATLEECQRLYLGGGDGVPVGLKLFDQTRPHLAIVRTWLWAQPPDDETDLLLIAEANATRQLGIMRDPLRKVRIPQLERALAAAQRQGNRAIQGRFLDTLGIAYTILGDPRPAIDYYRQALSSVREIGDRRGEANALGHLGNAYLTLGEVATATDLYRRRLATARAIADRREEGIALSNLGLAALASGNPRKALNYFECRLTLARTLGDRRGEGYGLSNIAHASVLLGDAAHALYTCQLGLTIAREVGERRLEGMALCTLGMILAAQGQTDRAGESFERSLAILIEIDDQAELARTRWTYGQFLARQGQCMRGLDLMAECIAYERRIGHAHLAEHAALLQQLRAGCTLPATAW